MANKDSSETDTGRCAGCSLACAVCKILCFTCCRRTCFPSTPAQRREFAVLCVGLGGAGKSTILASMAGESTENVGPTMGFAVKAIMTPRVILNVKELGGSDRIRPYWDKYFSGSEAIIFTIDSTASETDLSETQAQLQRCLEDQHLTKLPFLILCNKQDLPTAKPPQQLRDVLQLDSMIKDRTCIVMATSIKDEESLQSGFQQLVDALLRDT